jgi:hypothetical protein
VQQKIFKFESFSRANIFTITVFSWAKTHCNFLLYLLHTFKTAKDFLGPLDLLKTVLAHDQSHYGSPIHHTDWQSIYVVFVSQIGWVKLCLWGAGAAPPTMTTSGKMCGVPMREVELETRTRTNKTCWAFTMRLLEAAVQQAADISVESLSTFGTHIKVFYYY